MAAPALVLQTTYAELLERCAQASFATSFPPEGVFTPKAIKGRRYWYFQAPSSQGRAQKYVGPENPELLKHIEQHKLARSDERERRGLVSTLVRSFGMPQPLPQIGHIVEALANGGVFRLRGVLVGPVAYQAYAPMLGVKLSSPTLQTADIDVAQFKNVSVAVEDRTAPMLDVLKGADTSFRSLPTMHKDKVVSYAARGGLRVDFLTPNEGAATDRPQRLPALQTEAQPLRFLDYLIRDAQPAVLLHGAGIYVQVPAPARFAVHKLILARRRPEGAAKRDKDLRQSYELLSVLIERRAHDLNDAWREAFSRGRAWQRLLLEGAEQLPPDVRDKLFAVIGPLDKLAAKRKK